MVIRKDNIPIIRDCGRSMTRIACAHCSTNTRTQMKHIYIFILATLFSTVAIAQVCSGGPGANYIPITENSTITIPGNFWVCEGLTVEFTETAFVQVEDGCTITVSGGVPGSNFTVKSNGLVILNSPNHIVSFDSTNTTVIDNTGNNYPYPCGEMAWSYANAPAGGCAAPTSVTEEAVQLQLNIFPNPANDQLGLRSVDRIILVRIIDLSGREVLRSPLVGGVIDVSTVPSGVYVAMVRTANGEGAERVVIYR